MTEYSNESQWLSKAWRQSLLPYHLPNQGYMASAHPEGPTASEGTSWVPHPRIWDLEEEASKQPFPLIPTSVLHNFILTVMSHVRWPVSHRRWGACPRAQLTSWGIPLCLKLWQEGRVTHRLDRKPSCDRPRTAPLKTQSPALLKLYPHNHGHSWLSTHYVSGTTSVTMWIPYTPHTLTF